MLISFCCGQRLTNSLLYKTLTRHFGLSGYPAFVLFVLFVFFGIFVGFCLFVCLFVCLFACFGCPRSRHGFFHLAHLAHKRLSVLAFVVYG